MAVPRIAVLSFDAPESACGRVRVTGPFSQSGCAEVSFPVHLAKTRGDKGRIDGKALEHADAYLVQRHFPHAETMGLIESLLATGRPLVYETDDWLTNLPVDHPSHPAWANQSGYVEETIRRARAVLTSTRALADVLRPIAQRVVVVPNAVDLDLFRAPPHPAHGRLVLAYAGTSTHEPDLRLVEGPLLQLKREFGDQLGLVFFGCATQSLAAVSDAVIPAELGYASFAQRFCATPIDLAIAPLLASPFNDAKSDIKWLEYGACGIPAVFSRVPAYRDSVTHGEDGWLVENTPDAWLVALRELISDAPRRARLAAGAKAAARARGLDRLGPAHVHSVLEALGFETARVSAPSYLERAERALLTSL